jgi:hypothetical protein
LPILYHDSTAVLVFFMCDRQKAVSLLPDDRFRLALPRGAKTIVGLALFEYRVTSIGGYNEVGLALPVLWGEGPLPRFPAIDLLRNAHTRRVGYYVIDLPVTTAKADAAGRELWGYPKFVTRIDVGLEKKQLHCRVHDPANDTAIMILAGMMGTSIPAPALDLVTYSQIDAGDLRTTIQTKGRGRLHAPGQLRLQVGKSNHRMARHLRTLRLDTVKPLMVLVNTRFQSRLNQGVLLAPNDKT